MNNGINLTVLKVSADVYAKVLTAHDVRYFFNQMPEFAASKIAEGNKVDYLVFYQGQIAVGAALVVYYRFHKIFRYANCIFGPVLFNPEPSIFADILKLLRSTCCQSWRTRYMRLNPLLADKIYQDTKLQTTTVSTAYTAELQEQGWQRLKQEWYQNPSIHIRCLYSKTIKDLSYEQVVSSFAPKLKQPLMKVADSGVKVRFLHYEELAVFDRILDATYDRLNTITKTRPDFNRNLFRHFKEKIYFPLAYIECPEVLNNYRQQFCRIQTQMTELDNKYANNSNAKKYLNLKRDLQDQLNRLDKMRQTLAKLQAKHGDVLNIAGGCFIASGQDFIHLLGGGDKDFLAFNGIHAIHATMLKIAIEQGFTYYNLFGCSDLLDAETNNVDYGVLQFKRAFKGQFEELIGTYEYRK